MDGTSKPWAVPEACAPWPPSPAVRDVADAVVTPHERKQQKVDGRRFVRLLGAVHDADGWILPQSQRIAGINDRNVPSDPPRLSPVPADLERLTGQWYYLGHWMWQFGHFLIETLPNLWAHQGEPLLAHQFADDGAPLTWQRRLMELAGVTSPPRIVGSAPLQVQQLRVPTRPAVVGASTSPDAVDIWQRVARAGAGGPDLPAGQGRMVALSRSRHEDGMPHGGVKALRMVTNSRALDDLWRRHGFEVVHPELLSIDEQMAVVRSARVLMGVDGSGLHASAFTRPGTHVIVVGNRARPVGNLSQRAIDAGLGNPEAVLRWQGLTEESQDIDLDDHARKLEATLESLPGL